MSRCLKWSTPLDMYDSHSRYRYWNGIINHWHLFLTSCSSLTSLAELRTEGLPLCCSPWCFASAKPQLSLSEVSTSGKWPISWLRGSEWSVLHGPVSDVYAPVLLSLGLYSAFPAKETHLISCVVTSWQSCRMPVDVSSFTGMKKVSPGRKEKRSCRDSAS